MSDLGISTRPITALVISFLVISVIGCSFIFMFWLNFNLSEGILRSAAFVAMMGGVHFVGYRLWKRQPTTGREQKAQTEVRHYGSFWQAYREPIQWAVAQQLVVILFAALLLDGGRMFRLTQIAFVGAWVWNVIIMARRPKSPTEADVAIVKFGFWLAVVVTRVLAAFMGKVA